MRTFKKPGSIPCIICGTSKDGECILIGKDGTVEGNNEEAVVVHLDCLQLRYSQEMGIVYQCVHRDIA